MTESLLEQRDLDDALWAELRAAEDERTCIELLMLVGHYDMLATTLHTLRVPPEDHSLMFTTRPTLSGTFGMVSSTHWLASQSAQRMLELGGNAFDAAVAGGFVLHVVEPHLNGPGGDLPGHHRHRRRPHAAGALRPGPGAGPRHPRGVRGDGPRPRPRLRPARGRRPRRGRRLAAAAARPRVAPPGHGPRAGDRLRPRTGIPCSPRVEATIERVQDLFRESWTTSADLWLRDGRRAARGRAVRQPRLRRRCSSAWSTRPRPPGPTWPPRRRRPGTPGVVGFVAEAVEAFRETEWRHSGGEVLPGLVGGDDLAAFSATWEDPVVADWHGVQVAKTDLWGQGPALLQVPGDARPARAGRAGPRDRDGHPRDRRVLEARDGRPRGVVRRPQSRSPLGTCSPPSYVASRAALVGRDADRGVRPGRGGWSRAAPLAPRAGASSPARPPAAPPT